MAEVTSRDLRAAQAPITAWLVDHFAHQGPAVSDLTVDLRRHAGGGYSNEIILVTASFRRHGTPTETTLVFRLPPDGAALFPTYDLAMEVAVQDAVAAHGVPVPHPITHEPDPRWLGTPFLVMPFVTGHDPGAFPGADAWIASMSIADQALLHRSFLETLARIHTTPWRDQAVAGCLRGSGGSLADEITWWEKLVDWSFDGKPPVALTSLFTWCRTHQPRERPPSSVLWGDVRLGNVIFSDSYAPVAVLDWEMASIGPAELDLAWYLALDRMTEHFTGRCVAGFLPHDEVVAHHEAALGRPMVDLAWFEAFALCRSATLMIRADRLAELRSGEPPAAAEDNAVLAYTSAAIDELR